MALGSLQPPTEMSTRNLPGSKGRLAHKPDNLTAICEQTAYKLWESRRLRNLWVPTACYWDRFCKKENSRFKAVKININTNENTENL
jgi:hypothetical protein